MESSVTPTLLPLLAQGSLDVSADKDKDFSSNKIEKLTGMKLTEVCQLIIWSHDSHHVCMTLHLRQCLMCTAMPRNLPKPSQLCNRLTVSYLTFAVTQQAYSALEPMLHHADGCKDGSLSPQPDRMFLQGIAVCSQIKPAATEDFSASTRANAPVGVRSMVALNLAMQTLLLLEDLRYVSLQLL
jgi:hypothetical protein